MPLAAAPAGHRPIAVMVQGLAAQPAVVCLASGRIVGVCLGVSHIVGFPARAARGLVNMLRLEAKTEVLWSERKNTFALGALLGWADLRDHGKQATTSQSKSGPRRSSLRRAEVYAADRYRYNRDPRLRASCLGPGLLTLIVVRLGVLVHLAEAAEAGRFLPMLQHSASATKGEQS